MFDKGDVLSPNLFKVFLYDMPQAFADCSLNCDLVEINDAQIPFLLHADDLVGLLMSCTEKGL